MPDHPTPKTLTVLICSHNRVDLLSKVIWSLNRARAPEGWTVSLFVVANACTDGTHDYLEECATRTDGLPVTWLAEPTPGKSHALNRALPLMHADLVAFVDDDHRVDEDYLAAAARAADTWPEADLFCGRILPDWDGSEPPWVHDEGPYRIYPLPVPRYDQGPDGFDIKEDGPIPGGGNLAVRGKAIASIGPFATELGPTGHDLGGSEDADWILRALRQGAGLRYAPDILQFHYVDTERLTLSYIAKKGYQRSQSVTRVRAEYSRVPMYMWRKAAGYAGRLLFSASNKARRFYTVRLAASLGEISGIRDQQARKRQRRRLPFTPDYLIACALLLAAVVALIAAAAVDARWLIQAMAPAALVAGSLTAVLLIKSVRDFSRTGPTLRDEILQRYRGYVVFALGRLGLTLFGVAMFWALPGALLWTSLHADTTAALTLSWGQLIAAGLSLTAATLYSGCRKLAINPGLIIASWAYRTAPVHRLWRALSVDGLALISKLVIAAGALILGGLVVMHVLGGAFDEALALLLVVIGYAGILIFACWEPERGQPTRSALNRTHLVMIGSDTLRADRIGALRNGQSLTPNIDRLVARGAHFKRCYVPCARTAPSLLSLLTGTWPHRHGVRDNFVADEQTGIQRNTLPRVLRQMGYRTAAVSDWCGADLGKFDFGFDALDLPDDQWNLKYLIRQGPKDIRLFLSLFLHNAIGRRILPELYYLGGVPQTTELGKRGRRTLSRLAAGTEPFLLNLFYSTTHPPFASEYPYYLKYSDPAYQGESKFAMARLSEPFEIIRRQGEPREEFDLDQILALYDGCVSQFDDEVGKLLDHIETLGLTENTLVMLYSDHGMEFFEHDTWGQGNSVLGDASARVPLILAGPGIPGETKIDQVARTVDILPTVLDLLDAPSVKCDGVSLAGVIAHPEQPLDLCAFNETGIWIAQIPGQPEGHLVYPDLLHLLDVPDDSTGTLSIKREYQSLVLEAKDRMVSDGRWKLVYQPLSDGPKLSLYDLESDPECRRDVSATHPAEVERLQSRLNAWLADA